MTSAVALLLDFGASRVKAALYDPAAARFIAAAEAPAPEPMLGDDGAVEIPAERYKAVLAGLVAALTRQGPQIGAAYLTTEMHGFLLVDAAGRPLTPYISWRDERGVRSGLLDRLQAEHGARFRAITGMRLKPGLPFVTLAYLAARGQVPKDARVLCLADWIAGASARGGTDETMAAASGLYDIERRSWSDELLSVLASLGVPALQLPRVVDGRMVPVGNLSLGAMAVPVFGGIGDMQAAALGARIAANRSLCVNLGTGSQVSVIDGASSDARTEVRPFFDHRLTTVSHIPAGRALRVFQDFFDSLAGGESFWPVVAGLSAAEVLDSPLTVDLNLFATAWRWSGGGSISGIGETTLTPRGLAAAVVRAFAAQYPEAVSVVDPDRRCNTIQLAGGLARRIAILPELIATLSGREVRVPAAEEETLLGLALIAAAGKP